MFGFIRLVILATSSVPLIQVYQKELVANMTLNSDSLPFYGRTTLLLFSIISASFLQISSIRGLIISQTRRQRLPGIGAPSHHKSSGSQHC